MRHIPIVLLPAEYCDPERGVEWALACIRACANPDEWSFLPYEAPDRDDDARYIGRYLYALAPVLREAHDAEQAILAADTRKSGDT